jgi:hypothetical protein
MIDETHTDASLPHTTVTDQKIEAAVFGHKEDSKPKKPNKPPKNFLGMKKGK